MICDGILVVGRCERMGLGSMTEDFCRAFRPEHLFVVDRGRDQMFSPHEVAKNVYRAKEKLPSIPAGASTLVGFETFYDSALLVEAVHRKMDIVLFPMWEWTHPSHAHAATRLVVLSDTDAQWYESARDRVVSMRWPASPACHPTLQDERMTDPGEATINVDGRYWGQRVVNWPPKTFVHIAGNASHNRDGTTQVLEAAECLIGTDAKLVVYSAFHADKWEHDKMAPIEFRQAAASRRALFNGCDCLVQPRRLGGHSLPIDEAVGEGIPVITLAGDDWNPRASFVVDAIPQPAERFGRVWASMHRADPDELGALLYRLAVGDAPRPETKSVTSWDDFKADWVLRVASS